MISKEELKKLFENGDKPTQEEFWEWQDSYWHKGEKLPLETAGLYKIKGSVGTKTDLDYMTSMTEGDVYNVIETGDNYVYVLDLNNTGEPGWDKLSGIIDLANYQPLGHYVRIGGENTTGNNILLGWTGSELQATVDATTIGNLWHSGNFNPDSKVNKSGDTMTGALNIYSNGVLGTWKGNSVNSNYLIWRNYGDTKDIAYIGADGNSAASGGIGDGFAIVAPSGNLQIKSLGGVYINGGLALTSDSFDPASYVTQTSLNTQLGNYATLNFVEDSIDTTLAYTEATYVKKLENVIAVGFVRGNPDRPYLTHTNGTNVSVASENWTANNFASLNGSQTLIGENTFDKSPKVPFGVEPDDAVPYGQAEEIAQVRINYTFVEIIYKNSATDLTFNFGDYPSAKIVTITCKGNDFQNIRIENMPRGVTLKIMNASPSLDPTIYFDGGAIVTSLNSTSWAEFYRDQEGDIFISDVNRTNII
ncbi:hypothetical protein [Chryseobacterium indoltheticum]|uniref:hypothetical protein n=1 Tax=Chryseobacterium indoltheticum TaxID=254 RepID=UPI001912D839|nr:hypothetical protein [Chryseobacterium indoltheticum]QQQ26913.1 hypothetical protein JJL46_12360 [Chryseobacterium indoltheticum]